MKKSKDTGLRATHNGGIKVDKAVFYARKEIKDLIAKMRASKAYPNHSTK